MGSLAVSPPRRSEFATSDPEAAHDYIRTHYAEYRSEPSEVRPDFQFRAAVTGTDRFALERMHWNAGMQVETEPTGAVLIPHHRRGRYGVANSRGEHRLAPGDLVLLDETSQWRVDLFDVEVDAIRLDAPATVALVCEIADVPASGVEFVTAGPLSAARARLWLRTVRHVEDLMSNAEVVASPLARAEAFRLLVATLMHTFPNSALAELTDPEAPSPGAVTPATVVRAVAFMEEHAGEDIGLAEIAAAARLGARGLQLAFRRYRDCTPLEYLRRVRLERVHADLLAGDPATDAIAEIAARWGFTHGGNFAAFYREHYGHTPRVTLGQ